MEQEQLVVELGGAGDIDRLEPLWVSVHHQHRQAMPELAPYVTDATTWRERRARDANLSERFDPVLLLARATDRLVGYGLGCAMPATGTWLAGTWDTGELIGEIESLSVLPDFRGRGLGSRLLAGLGDLLREQGAVDLILGALAGNADALRLYRRNGYRPTWLYLSRLAGRDRPEPPGDGSGGDMRDPERGKGRP